MFCRRAVTRPRVALPSNSRLQPTEIRAVASCGKLYICGGADARRLKRRSVRPTVGARGIAVSVVEEVCAARDSLLRSAVAVFEAEPAVLAVWLGGSSGRGEDDPLSDVDVEYQQFIQKIAYEQFGRQWSN